MNPIVIISQAVAAGGLTGARPVLTLFLIQLYAAFVAKTELAEGLGWILNPYVIGVLGALAVVEHFVRTDPDFEQVMKIPNQVICTAVALMTAFLLVSMGYDPATLPASDAALPSLLDLIHTAGAGQGGVLTASLIVSVAASLGLGWLRSKALDAFEALAVPSKWWRWIEAGGVAGLLTIIVLLPFVAVALAALMIIGSTLAAFALNAAQRAHERRHRRPCPACQAAIRVEASLCPACGAEVTPQTLLDAEPAATTAA